MEKDQNWYFSFGCGQLYEGRYVKLFGTKESTRQQMFDKFGRKWSMQYSEEEWNSPSKDSLKWNNLNDGKPHTLAEVWHWKEIG